VKCCACFLKRDELCNLFLPLSCSLPLSHFHFSCQEVQIWILCCIEVLFLPWALWQSPHLCIICSYSYRACLCCSIMSGSFIVNNLNTFGSWQRLSSKRRNRLHFHWLKFSFTIRREMGFQKIKVKLHSFGKKDFICWIPRVLGENHLHVTHSPKCAWQRNLTAWIRKTPPYKDGRLALNYAMNVRSMYQWPSCHLVNQVWSRSDCFLYPQV
jgi:hypothetical protein